MRDMPSTTLPSERSRRKREVMKKISTSKIYFFFFNFFTWEVGLGIIKSTFASWLHCGFIHSIEHKIYDFLKENWRSTHEILKWSDRSFREFIFQNLKWLTLSNQLIRQVAQIFCLQPQPKSHFFYQSTCRLSVKEIKDISLNYTLLLLISSATMNPI